ncbi:family 20 glycosylhydrolase [Paenibacillus sp. HB172176]|uniref:family 20 glycosylhydrolase n=1 Tax=Paenibacillus sp. HB172176 TaxID=2493690 RepID=UPI0014392499|nr:family 20 glycosylhydrolase [Paenibacillus sp. HB172176]
MTTISTLPQIKWYERRDGDYRLNSEHRLILNMKASDSRLAAAAKRLFPELVEGKGVGIAEQVRRSAEHGCGVAKQELGIAQQELGSVEHALDVAQQELGSVEHASGSQWPPFVLYIGPLEAGHAFDFTYLSTFITASSSVAAESELNEALQASEGYCMKVRSNGIWLVSGEAAGLFYGMQTLKQLFDQAQLSYGVQLPENAQLPTQAPFLPACDVEDWPDVPLRVMNYDFRQTFSKPEKLIEYLDDFAALKTNALLIEYEDKFPFERNREFRHPEYALRDSQLNELLAAAERNFIEIIPLQQSFGHLEYILGRVEYRSLRENEASTGELCPSNPASFELVSGLLTEMATKHTGSRYLHLGCDEVYSICECPVCRERYGNSRNLAFLDFVNRLIAFTCELGKKPIIWQDVLAHCSDEELGKLDSRVTIMIWHYNGKMIDRIASELTLRLRKLGIPVIGAPSVRCFDRKDDQNYPVVDQRISNVDQWVAAAGELALDGLVGTNWTAVFSLGVPYGVFETSWYTMAYFADRCWNSDEDAGGSFMSRFLSVFHGIAPEKAAELLGNYSNEDYYVSMPALLKAVTRNEDVAELISAMLAFETASDRSRTTHKYVYRATMFPDNEAERRSLLNNYRITRRGLEAARGRMKEALLAFQPEAMADHYVLSRYYLHDYLEETLYQELGLKL